MSSFIDIIYLAYFLLLLHRRQDYLIENIISLEKYYKAFLKEILKLHY